MGRFGPRVDARSLCIERVPSENLSGLIGSHCVTPCAEVITCHPSGELSTRLDVLPYSHLPNPKKDRNVPAASLS
jgi:hypothetical protein